MNQQQQAYYSTSDLALATVLSLNFQIEKIDKESEKKALFLFKKTTELITIVNSYWNGEIKIDPRLFVAQEKNLKTRIYSEILNTR